MSIKSSDPLAPASARRAGRIVILNGVPRSGKSSIVAALQDDPGGAWMNLGVDAFAQVVTPPRLRPGIGLRPGGERPDLEAWLPTLYAALYESIAAHSRLGFDVVVDVGHHDAHSCRLGILSDCARRLEGLPVLFVGVRCPIGTIMHRRRSGTAPYVSAAEGEPVPDPVLAWQREVHRHGLYDLEVDTSLLRPEACAAAILAMLSVGIASPCAFERLAAIVSPSTNAVLAASDPRI